MPQTGARKEQAGKVQGVNASASDIDKANRGIREAGIRLARKAETLGRKAQDVVFCTFMRF